MFSIKKENSYINNFDFNNCIFSSGPSRPSKSLINCNLYKEYNKINFNLDILNEFSYINSQNKKIEHFILREIINNFKLDISDIDVLSISFDSIIINEINNNNLIFCFDYDISLRNLLINLNELIKELQNNDSIIMNFSNLYTYPSSELLLIFCNLFDKVKIYYSKLLKQNIIYCKNYNQNSSITVFIKNVLKKWNKDSHIRQFGIYVKENIINEIKIHNNNIFNYYINLYDNLINSSIEDKEYFFKNYIKQHNKNNNTCLDCNHEIKEFNLLNCYICSKCYDLFMLY